MASIMDGCCSKWWWWCKLRPCWPCCGWTEAAVAAIKAAAAAGWAPWWYGPNNGWPGCWDGSHLDGLRMSPIMNPDRALVTKAMAASIEAVFWSGMPSSLECDWLSIGETAAEEDDGAEPFTALDASSASAAATAAAAAADSVASDNRNRLLLLLLLLLLWLDDLRLELQTDKSVGDDDADLTLTLADSIMATQFTGCTQRVKTNSCLNEHRSLVNKITPLANHNHRPMAVSRMSFNEVTMTKGCCSGSFFFPFQITKVKTLSRKWPKSKGPNTFASVPMGRGVERKLMAVSGTVGSHKTLLLLLPPTPPPFALWSTTSSYMCACVGSGGGGLGLFDSGSVSLLRRSRRTTCQLVDTPTGSRCQFKLLRYLTHQNPDWNQFR